MRAAAWNQWLWTAGYPLTAGGFVIAAARRDGAAAWVVACLLILPETVGLTGLLTRRLLRFRIGRKRLFFATTIVSRLLLLPAGALFWFEESPAALAVAAVAVAASHAVGAVGYVGFLSWLSDVVPPEGRGRLFGWRNFGRAAGLLTLPVLAGFGERAVRDLSGDTAADRFGIAMFLTGLAVQALSVLPLRRVDEPAYAAEPRDEVAAFRTAWRRRRFRRWLWHEWGLAAASGLTQAAFFLYATSAGLLNLSLGTFYGLLATMRLMQLAISPAAGVRADRADDPVGMRVVGVTIASAGLLFWIAATPGRPWLVAGAYLAWGAYAWANVAGSKILLARAGGRDNAGAIGLARQTAGLLAGLSGLAGGLWLDAMTESSGDGPATAVWAFHTLFAASLAGRLLSLWPLAFAGDETRGRPSFTVGETRDEEASR
ncbi:MAG: MFS transporter [Planctomycetota bacterium]